MKFFKYIALICLLIVFSQSILIAADSLLYHSTPKLDHSILKSFQNSSSNFLLALDIDNNNSTKKSKKEQKPTLDTDDDGIPDSIDLCPEMPGSIDAKGCPDIDGDGIPDFEDACPNTPGLAEFKGCPDTDRDGVPDNLDVCPHEKGPASNNGCPIKEIAELHNTKDKYYEKDSDSDGVPDADDLCPDVPGDRRTFGCPDIDEDNIPDYEDLCPYEKGPASSGGCPVEEGVKVEKDRNIKSQQSIKLESPPNYTYKTQGKEEVNTINPTENFIIDTDKDGIADYEDKCPEIPGHKSNNGCPLNPSKLIKVSKRDIILFTEERTTLENIFTNIAFDKGRMFLTSNSYAYLDRLCDLLSKRINWNITIVCFTDEADNSYRNQQLSSNRGKQIQDYLILKGIAPKRIDVKGNGYLLVPDLPSNRTEILISRD